MNNFFNTIGSEGTDLKQYILKAKGQELKILTIFNSHPDYLTPDMVHSLGFDDSTPITSIRRAMSNLTDKGLLIKTERMVKGNYGKLTHCWRVKQIVKLEQLELDIK